MKTDERIQTKRAFRVKEVPPTYGIGRTKVYELINAGKLKTIKIGGRRLILADSLEALLRGDALDG